MRSIYWRPRTSLTVWTLAVLLLTLSSSLPPPISLLHPLLAQPAEHEQATISRDTLIAVAREIMDAARFCTFVTLDESGQPHSRTMDPFQPGEDMVVRMGTTRASRKVREIENDPRVNLH